MAKPHRTKNLCRDHSGNFILSDPPDRAFVMHLQVCHDTGTLPSKNCFVNSMTVFDKRESYANFLSAPDGHTSRNRARKNPKYGFLCALFSNLSLLEKQSGYVETWVTCPFSTIFQTGCETGQLRSSHIFFLNNNRLNEEPCT